MSRPAVSEQISLLEQKLGVRLLHRTTRKLSLTNDGDLIYPHAAEINQRYLTIKDLLSQNELKGVIRVTTTVDFAVEWLSPRLPLFKEKYPEIDFEFLTSDDRLDLIKDQIDFGVRIGIPSDDQLIARPLFKQRMGIFASPEYLNKAGIPKNIEDSQLHSWILLAQMQRKPYVRLWNKDQQCSLDPETSWLSNSPAASIAQMKAGLGLGMAFPMLIEQAILDKQLINVLPEWQSEEMTFALVYASRKNMSARAQAFRDFVLEQAAQS